MKQIDRTKLAIWAEGTEFTTDDLVHEYRSYLAACRERAALNLSMKVGGLRGSCIRGLDTE